MRAGNTADNERELVLPAINGVKSVLDAAKNEPRVKRIVFVSSFAAVADVAKDAAPGYTYTSADWNPMPYDEGKADPTFAYRIGKTYAERAAWDCIRHDHPHFDLVTFCPPAVFGPIVHPVARVADLNLSNAVLWSITRTHGGPLPVQTTPCWIDVRDLAYAIVEALLRPEISNRRYTIAAPEHFSYQRAADIVRKELEWTREVVTKGNEGEAPPDAFDIDSQTAAKDLGVKYRKFRETVLDAISQFRQIQLQQR